MCIRDRFYLLLVAIIMAASTVAIYFLRRNLQKQGYDLSLIHILQPTTAATRFAAYPLP